MRWGSDRVKRRSKAGKTNDMKHSEGFLKIVNDAKTRIKEVTVADTRDRLATNSAPGSIAESH
jgi:hypothetical protein